MRKSIFIGIGLLYVLVAAAQKDDRHTSEAFNELAHLGDMYKKLPFQFQIQIQNAAIPITATSDTMQTVMDLYMATHALYMQSEGLEEIINDSLVVLVNNRVKEMQLYRSDAGLASRFVNIGSMLLQDSSKATLQKKFNIDLKKQDENTNNIDLTSRRILPGTSFPTEFLHISYYSGNHQIIECSQHKNRLIPIELSVYASLKDDNQFDPRLIHSTGEKGDMYFLVKENITTYRFIKVDYNVVKPPVAVKERIIKSRDEKYLPATGFEEYLVKQQF